MRYVTGLLLALGLLISGCASLDEVIRVPSPDGKVEAILFETNCGAPCSFGYEVRLVTKGSRHGDDVASLEGAVRNDKAWGVNLKWVAVDQLTIEYFRAERAKVLKQTVDIAGHNVNVSLRAGVYDPLAPAGGMLYNLHDRPRD